MDPHTGHLMRISDAEMAPGDYEIVPRDYEKLAAMKMRVAQALGHEPIVNMRGNSPLAKWGRGKLRDKHKAKIAAASKRKNRK
jgi:hypothetical protein